jgi:hypothetical protein
MLAKAGPPRSYPSIELCPPIWMNFHILQAGRCRIERLQSSSRYIQLQEIRFLH